jgi:glycosyltransferase involved in cell wall biosynthesis
MPLVSIIIPVHNRQSLLPAALDSVAAQTFQDWECIVVDDHSTDGSLAVAEEYARRDGRFRGVSAPAGGRYPNAARNYGLSLARGELINFLDSDDCLTADKLEIQLRYFESCPNLDAVACRHDITGERDGALLTSQLQFAAPPHWLDVLWYPGYGGRYGGLWCTNAPLWRKSSIEKIGGWDAALRAWQDDDVNVRALLGGLQIERLEQILVHVYKTGADQVNSQSYEKSAHVFKGLQKTWQLLCRAGQDTPLRRRMISFTIYTQARWLVKEHNLSSGLDYWIRGARLTQQPPAHTFHGLALLLFTRFSLTLPIYHRLRPSFFAALDTLPDAI